jgi:hypothetical protein
VGHSPDGRRIACGATGSAGVRAACPVDPDGSAVRRVVDGIERPRVSILLVRGATDGRPDVT